MFYDLYCELCDAKGVPPTRAAIEIGISKSSPTTWKNSGSIPKSEILAKIAEYFDVSVDYLLGKEEKSAPTETGESAELTEEQKRLQALAEKISKLSPKKLAVLESLLDAMENE